MSSALSFSPSRFRAWRQERQLKQADLARLLHYTRALITMIERGKTPPTARFFEAVERTFPGTKATRDFFRGLLLSVALGGWG